MKFWPILASVHQRPVFIIAIYKGKEDPKSCTVYIRRFGDETLPYFRNGIEVGKKNYKFQLVCILADAPARAFLLGMKYHTGFFSCVKCTVRGVYCARRVCFPLLQNEEKPPLRYVYHYTWLCICILLYLKVTKFCVDVG